MTLFMKADIHAKWIEELRSGNYEQGAGDLHSVIPQGFDVYEEKFCCLGILCVMGKRAGVVESERAARVVFYGTESVYLPQEIVDWAGLRFEGYREYPKSRIEEPRGVLTNGTREGSYLDGKSLARMNDSGVPFDEIADVIQAEVIPY